MSPLPKSNFSSYLSLFYEGHLSVLQSRVTCATVEGGICYEPRESEVGCTLSCRVGVD